MIRKVKFLTRKDYESLNPYDAIKYDKRNFLELFHNRLLDDHLIWNLIFVDSIMEPLWLRKLTFFTQLNLNFFMSALFFSDDYIDSRAEIPKELRVK